MADSDDKSKNKNQNNPSDAHNKTQEQDSAVPTNSTEQLEFDTSIFLELIALRDTNDEKEKEMEAVQQKNPILPQHNSKVVKPEPTATEPPHKPKTKR